MHKSRKFFIGNRKKCGSLHTRRKQLSPPRRFVSISRRKQWRTEHVVSDNFSGIYHPIYRQVFSSSGTVCRTFSPFQNENLRFFYKNNKEINFNYERHNRSIILLSRQVLRWPMQSRHYNALLIKNNNQIILALREWCIFTKLSKNTCMFLYIHLNLYLFVST